MRDRTIESIPGLSPDARRILVAVAEEVDMWERRQPNAGRWDSDYQTALQIWEAAIAAVGGKTDA